MSELKQTIKAQLVAYKKDYYSTLVFENLEKDKEYVMCSLPPNWKEEIPEPNTQGFLTYESTVAGSTQYFDKNNNQFRHNLYSNNYFLNFVPLMNEKKDSITIKIK